MKADTCWFAMEMVQTQNVQKEDRAGTRDVRTAAAQELSWMNRFAYGRDRTNSSRLSVDVLGLGNTEPQLIGGYAVDPLFTQVNRHITQSKNVPMVRILAECR